MATLHTLENLISEHRKTIKDLDLALRNQKIALEITIKDFNKELKNNPPTALITLESKKGNFDINEYMVFLDNVSTVQVDTTGLYGGRVHLPPYFKSRLSQSDVRKIDKALDRKVIRSDGRLSYFTLVHKEQTT